MRFGCLFGLGNGTQDPVEQMVFFMRCPASALKCVGPGPLGDASGSLSLVLASVNVYSVWFFSCILLALRAAFVK